MLSSLIWISLSYTGFNAAIYVTGESRDATSLVPKAMLWATVLVTILYVLLNAVFLYAAPAESIDAKHKLQRLRWIL